MGEFIDIETARKIMGENFIGIDDLNKINILRLDVSKVPYHISFSKELLMEKRDHYILLPGVSRFLNGNPVTIRNLIRIFGKNPEKLEPCFYNQDWYECEAFIDIAMEDKWYFIRKSVYENSRAVQPVELIEKYEFPLAISSVYAFFVTWLVKNEKLWYHDYVWCRDVDHNGDRVYVGKYNDIDGVNKNGFSIHRHLSLRACYACID